MEWGEQKGKVMRKMATDSDGDTYVSERSVGDAVVRVLPDTIQKERRGDGTAVWLTASYEVCGPDGEVGEIIVRNASGTYDVPEKAQRVGLSQAVAIALGRDAPPPPAPRRDLEAALAASLASTQPQPQVHQEPPENWERRQGDRIMRHLALYPDGIDPQTMSAGMRWTFAKTMPKWPHEYVLVWLSPDPWLHLRVVAFIRAVGERRRWGHHFHHYWTWGDHEYWAMPPRETILNRRRLDWPS